MRIRSTASLAAAAFVLAACSESLPTDATANLDPSYTSENAANPATQGNKLQCFDGDTEGGPSNLGQCELVEGGADIFVPGFGWYAGVYVNNSNLDGKLLSDINKLAFTYVGNGTTGGSPRITFPIDFDGNGTWDDFVSADAIGCTDGDMTAGTVDVINDETCLVSLNSGGTYPNWDAFVAAYPDARVATDAVSFVIVDQPGEFTITNVQLGRGAAKSRP